MKTSVMFALLSAFAINAAAVEYEEHDYNDGDVEIWEGNVSINGRYTAACVKKNSVPPELETKRVVIVKTDYKSEWVSDDSDQKVDVAFLRKYFCEVAEKVAEKDYYLPSGKLKEERYYKNGELDGVRRKYYEDGKLEYESFYKNGKREGIMKDYYENGRLSEETPFKNDQKEGVRKWYNEKGKLKKTTEYKDGNVISGACHAANDKATPFTQEQITKENSLRAIVHCP